MPAGAAATFAEAATDGAAGAGFGVGAFTGAGGSAAEQAPADNAPTAANTIR